MNQCVIDAHTHAVLLRSADGALVADISTYRRRARAAGITQCAVFAPFHHDYPAANRAVAALARAAPHELHGFVFVHARRDAGRIQDMVRWAVTRQFRCIKVHRRDAALSHEICEAASTYDIPILYDIMGEVDTVPCWATAYPQLNFIIPHLGSFQEDVRAQMAFLHPLTEFPNVFTDTSGVRYFDLLARAIELAGAEKVLFGSDAPWLHPGVELAKIRALQLNHAEESLVLGGNFQRLMRLTPARQSSAPLLRGSRSCADSRALPA